MMHAPDLGYFDGARATILRLQNADGSIPWFKGGVIDPWNHLEATMGLQILGERAAAEQAIAYLQNSQLEDGSWWGQLGSAVPIDMKLHQFSTMGMDTGHQVRDTNFTAYIATAAYHHYLTFQDMAYTQNLWPCVEAAITFVLGLQYDEGDIRWTARDAGTPEEDSLVTGNSSIYKSLGHAIKLGTLLEQPVDN
ncbi:MAG: prenyltransferase, partial [Pseudomonadota bacterium]|nr:prenyltransferase [Pseudomonadota bacterium]